MAARAVIAVIAVLTVVANIELGWGWPVALAAGVAVVLVGELAGALVKRQQPRPPSAGKPGDPSPLSPRELEVAVLVARGLTNKEVARRLAIKEQTVGRHLENINKELGIHSRVQLTNWVHDRRLLESPASTEASRPYSQT